MTVTLFSASALRLSRRQEVCPSDNKDALQAGCARKMRLLFLVASACLLNLALSWLPTITNYSRKVQWRRASHACRIIIGRAERVSGRHLVEVIDPRDGSVCHAIDNNLFGKRSFGANLFGIAARRVLVIVMPQLGEFDSWEYAEQL